MNTTIGNQLEQKQNIILTPKMVEELKILQMPNIELAQYIEVALVENPMLEAETEEGWVGGLLKDRLEYPLPEEDRGLGDNTEDKDFTEYTANPISLTQFLVSQMMGI
jgi:DNA-directed RNA polymerase specialized sigma54-like protein